ncbi:MAG: hypothetical protein K0U40_05100 [Betaproteobacteria bacterium]|nr:hypothetical protein [Betaproteobacteria bacterium]
MKTISHEPSKLRAEIDKYWSEERREKAIPKPLPEPPQTIVGDDTEAPWLDQIPVVTPPNISAKDRLKSEKFTRSQLADPVTTPEVYPYRCNGKLFFCWQGKDWVGSAGSIYLDVLLTAAHNIYDEGEWSDMFLYYPAYPDLINPGLKRKSWGWSRAAIFTAWKNSTNFAFDYAMLLTDSSMKEVGSQGYITNLPPQDRIWTAYGYPSAAPYPGNQMFQTAGNYVSGNTIITMQNNDMTKGSSGGNWITQHKGKNYVNGVQSTRGSKATYANSPYLDNMDFEDLVKCVTKGNCE